jgi:hypothetical protein
MQACSPRTSVAGRRKGGSMNTIKLWATLVAACVACGGRVDEAGGGAALPITCDAPVPVMEAPGWAIGTLVGAHVCKAPACADLCTAGAACTVLVTDGWSSDRALGWHATKGVCR